MKKYSNPIPLLLLVIYVTTPFMRAFNAFTEALKLSFSVDMFVYLGITLVTGASGWYLLNHFIKTESDLRHCEFELKIYEDREKYRKEEDRNHTP